MKNVRKIDWRTVDLNHSVRVDIKAAISLLMFIEQNPLCMQFVIDALEEFRKVEIKKMDALSEKELELDGNGLND